MTKIKCGEEELHEVAAILVVTDIQKWTIGFALVQQGRSQEADRSKEKEVIT